MSDNSKEITHRFECVDGSTSINEMDIISVVSRKNATVVLCIKGNMHIPIASIKLYDSNLFVDAEACFDSAAAIGKEIERRWQLQAENKELRAELEKALNWMEWTKLRNHCECEQDYRCVKCLITEDIITAEQALKEKGR